MLRSSFQRAKFVLVSLVKQNPTLWSFFWVIGSRLGFLLPHDRSYFGFAHFAVSSGLFLDIGANNGITALGVRKVLPDYRIISIEADISHRPALERVKRRLRAFHYMMIGASDVERDLVLYTPRVAGRLIHALTSSDLDYLKISVARDFGTSRARRARYEQRVVKCMPLDQLKFSPDIIKIDVEGYELPALTGLSATIDRQRPIILVEFTPGFFDKTKKFLDMKGYQYLTYDEQQRIFRRFDHDRDSRAWSARAPNQHVLRATGEARQNCRPHRELAMCEKMWPAANSADTELATSW